MYSNNVTLMYLYVNVNKQFEQLLHRVRVNQPFNKLTNPKQVNNFKQVDQP
jgi:hypothetical protein